MSAWTWKNLGSRTMALLWASGLSQASSQTDQVATVGQHQIQVGSRTAGKDRPQLDSAFAALKRIGAAGTEGVVQLR